MGWLANIDARSRVWPPALRWPYRALKGLLIGIGVWCVVGLAWMEWRDGKPALGLGILVAATLALVKGVIMAVHRLR